MKANQNPSESQEKANQNPSESQKKPNHKPITINHKPNIKTYNAPADADAPMHADAKPSQAEAEEIPSETQVKAKKAKPSKADAWKALLAENGIVGQLADDYIAIRLAFKHPKRVLWSYAERAIPSSAQWKSILTSLGRP